jgi:hypothetical protein
VTGYPIRQARKLLQELKTGSMQAARTNGVLPALALPVALAGDLRKLLAHPARNPVAMPDSSPYRSLATGMAITGWQMSGPEETHFPGVARPMPDKVDYRFINGWVDTGDLPCREALLKRIPSQPPNPPCPVARFDQVVLADDDGNVDFSRFCHRPTLIRRVFRCRVRSDKDHQARFELRTCGGVRIWLDNAHITTFQPFTRNRQAKCELGMHVGTTQAEITLELEDLHERDTTCFFQLRLIDGNGVETSFQSGDVDGSRVAEAADAMASLRTDKVFYRGGTAFLLCDNPPSFDVTIMMTDSGSFSRGGIAGLGAELAEVSGLIGPKHPPIALFSATNAPQGCIGLRFKATVDGATITRQIGTTVLARTKSLDQPDLAGRKAAALRSVVSQAAFDPSVAVALLSSGQGTERANAIIDRALHDIELRHDCADFSLLPMLRIARDFVPQLSQKRAKRLRDAILGFRYWLDEPGDDVMWFWSENHVLCFHIAQLLAGELYPTAIFTNSGEAGAVLKAEATARLHRWFNAIDRDGLGEWNSSAYYPIDLLGLLTLHDMTGDDALRQRAAKLMDQIFAMTALHYCGGVSAGSQGRAYEKELLAGSATELASVAAVAFGGVMVPGFDRATALFALSDYAPPVPIQLFAHLLPGTTLEARYTQGHDHLGKLTLWKTSSVQLSSVSDHKSGQPGHQQHLIDVQCAAHPMARLWVNHPGELKVWGERRPSLLAGNGILPRVAQCGALAMAIYDIPDDPAVVPFTQCFAAQAAFDDVDSDGSWTIYRCGQASIGVWCSVLPQLVSDGLYAGSLHRAHARRCAWLITVGAEEPVRFAKHLQRCDIAFDSERLMLTARGFAVGDICLGFSDGLSVDGKPQTFETLTPVPQLRLARNDPWKPWTDWQ